MTKVAVVTGASTGIGAELATQLASAGWTVFAVARRRERLEQLDAGSGSIVPVVADLASTNGVSAAVAQIKSNSDRVDLLANIAGVWHNDDEAFYGPMLWELPEQQLLDVMNVGIVAPMLLARSIVPMMIGNSGSSVVNLSGTFSSGGRGWVHYYVSKKALEQFTIALADELKDHGVRVNCVSPADTATEPYIKFYPEDAATGLVPEEVARFIVHLCEPEMHRVNGQIIELRAVH